MAKLFPAQPDPDTPSSERKLREKLHNALPEDWIVLHSTRFLLPAGEQSSTEEGEVDFLIIDRDRGYLGLEVKGGGVGRDPNGWYTIDRFGAAHKIKDPGKQATRAVHMLDRYLCRQPWFRENKTRVKFGWGVALPDVDADFDLGPDLPRELVLDRSGLANLRKRIDEMFRSNQINGPKVPTPGLQALLRALAPSFQLVPSLVQRMDEEYPMLVRLTDEQMAVLDTLEEFPRVAIRGAAGTGKTLVALEKARRLATAGLRVLFLCFNRPLADYLAAGAEGFTVASFHAYCKQMADSAGVPFKVPKTDEATRKFWEEDAVDKLIEALDVYPDERFDAVVVDEGQDFREYWWLAVEKLLKDPKNGTLYVFYDPNQDLYGGGPIEVLGLRSAPLSVNCRNTARIAKHSAHLVALEPKLRPDTPEGLEVSEVSATTPKEMVDAVRKALHRFVVEEKVPPDRIVVLTVGAAEASPVWRQRTLGNVTLVEQGTRSEPNQVPFATLQRFKGLEADVVILCDVDPTSKLCSARHLYVGTSRARHILCVVTYA